MKTVNIDNFAQFNEARKNSPTMRLDDAHVVKWIINSFIFLYKKSTNWMARYMYVKLTKPQNSKKHKKECYDNPTWQQSIIQDLTPYCA